MSNELYRGYLKDTSNKDHSIPFTESRRTSIMHNCASKYNIDHTTIAKLDALIIKDKSNNDIICNIAGSCEITMMTDDKKVAAEVISDLENALNQNEDSSEIKIRKENHSFKSEAVMMAFTNNPNNMSQYVSKELFITSFTGAISGYIVQQLDKLGVGSDDQGVILQLVPILIFLIIAGLGVLVKFLKKNIKH